MVLGLQQDCTVDINEVQETNPTASRKFEEFLHATHAIIWLSQRSCIICVSVRLGSSQHCSAARSGWREAKCINNPWRNHIGDIVQLLHVDAQERIIQVFNLEIHGITAKICAKQSLCEGMTWWPKGRSKGRTQPGCRLDRALWCVWQAHPAVSMLLQGSHYKLREVGQGQHVIEAVWPSHIHLWITSVYACHSIWQQHHQQRINAQHPLPRYS
mmetsp:Transcript_68347/g.163987  ORF Transcript_68347/g.163987 Transcript_68347/m.163987 type:complete len:214 (+) Transcript_68347:2255-2896(+)